MLAGRMRLRTFLALVGGGLGLFAVVGVLGSGWLASKALEESKRREAAAKNPEPDAAVWALVQPRLAAELDGGHLTDVDAAAPFRVDLERVAMSGGPDRVLVDLDRDGRFDERWMVHGGRISRQVSSGDDEDYDYIHFFNGRTWSDLEPPPVAPLTGPGPEKRDVDELLLGYRGKDLGTDKLKDVSAGRPFKVNVYQDPGETSANRAKVDLDRDEQDDEKWEFSGGMATRHVSTRDDGVYDQSFVWTDDRGWVEVSAGSGPVGGTVANGSGPSGREVDGVVLGYRGRALGSDKLKDVTAGRPYKVNVYQDAGKATANRAKVDLDRDDKWDEKFTFDGDRVERQVAPQDDENYSETWLWDGSGWTRP